MIYCLGLSSELANIRQHFDEKDAFEFKDIPDLNSVGSLSEADLFLIGPTVDEPIKAVQRVVSLDNLISIIVLTRPARYAQVKQSLQFSLLVGKNTTCVVYKPETNYAVMFRNGVIRTKQKRKFDAFGLAAELKVAELASPHTGLEHLGHVLEHAPIGAVLLDADFRIIGANKAFRRKFNVEGGSVFLNLLFPEGQIDALRSVGYEKGPITVHDFTGRYYEVTASGLSSGKNASTILLVNDITEKTEKDRTIAAILESLPQIAWTAKPDGSIDYLNEGWFNYTGRPPSEVGSPLASEIHPLDVALTDLKWKESVTAGTPFQHLARLKRFDGEYRWHLVRAVPVLTKNRQITTWVGTSTDIHEQVILTETLERKVNERTKLLQESNAELEQFAHISSHDLQEPLRKIQTFADIIKGESSSLSENTSRYIDKIVSTAGRMSRLLKDLLSYSKINQQEAEELVDLNHVVDHIKEDLELLLSQNAVIMHVSDLPTVKARPLQIRQLFYNIINNSIKYRKPDVVPEISITCRMLDADGRTPPGPGSYWEIVVRDNGIGFDQKYADQIFTVFQRLHSGSLYGGTGIGLAIAKKVVANHGGDIFAISSPGKGAAFHVVLPAIS